MANKTCAKCGRTFDEKNFYQNRQGEKYKLCKKCLTMHVDNFDTKTFLWILEELDMPYIPSEWNVLRDRAYEAARLKGKSMTGMSVLGKYLGKMRLKQHANETWVDTERLMAEEEERKRESQEQEEKFMQDIKEKYENGEISEAEYRTFQPTEKTKGDDFFTLSKEEMKKIAAEGRYNGETLLDPVMTPPTSANPFDAIAYIDESELPNPGDQLTQEDRLMLAMKWGTLYKPNEWVELEKNYTEMTAAFDVQDPDTRNSLILLCKTNLKMNQAIDIGDLDGYQKLARTYDALRKSAKFTAVQNKEGRDGVFDSVGELVAMCEKQGFIPRFAPDTPQDKVDLVLRDNQNYVKKLVTQDLGFGQQIEDALLKIKMQKDANEEADQEYYFDDEESDVISDDDFTEYYTEVQNQKESDSSIYDEWEAD